jgi:hypothetical protein
LESSDDEDTVNVKSEDSMPTLTPSGTHLIIPVTVQPEKYDYAQSQLAKVVGPNLLPNLSKESSQAIINFFLCINPEKRIEHEIILDDAVFEEPDGKERRETLVLVLDHAQRKWRKVKRKQIYAP